MSQAALELDHLIGTKPLAATCGALSLHYDQGAGCIAAQRGFNVREIVRIAKNSHVGNSPKYRFLPRYPELVPGAARGIRTPDPVITKGEVLGFA
jgi:hypothetical protein